jgi:hypothetical protein
MAVDPGDRAASRDVRKTPVGLPIAWIQSRTGTLLGQLLSPATGPLRMAALLRLPRSENERTAGGRAVEDDGPDLP